jgi:hypothetical protein
MLITLTLTILIFFAVLVVLVWVRTPRYRIERANVIALLELVVAGRATENDWRVFAAVPLRHDLQLDEIRERCLDIEEREYVGHGHSRFLFSQQGLRELQEILELLKQDQLDVKRSSR